MENFEVNFVIDGFPCQGFLNREGNLFDLDVKSSLSTISYKPRKITCWHEHRAFVLYNNQIRSRKIFPEFVIENYETPFFKTFEFCLDGLQDFLSVSELYDGKVFSEKVVIDKISYLCECVTDAEKTTVKITPLCQRAELEKINGIVQRFVQLFTLVSYKRVTCTSIHIVEDREKHEFFSWRCKPFTGIKSRHYSLLHAGLIYSKGLWKNILDNYFGVKNDFFESCLNGYIDLIDGDSLFAHNIINVCGIWDYYTKLTREKVDCQYTSQDFDDVFDFLQKTTKKEYMKFSEPQQKVIDVLFEKRESVKNTIGPHLYEKICVLYNQFDEKFRLLFPSALHDFKSLKKARAKYAHGEISYRPKEGFEELYQIYRRIRLMTIVFIYQELGISLVEICKGLRNSLHGSVINVELDRFVLSSIVDDTPFFNVDEKTWEYFSQPRIFSCFVYNPSLNLLELDKTTTELAWKEHLRSDEPLYGNYITKVYPKCKDPVYQNNIFIIFGDAHKEINGSFLLNYEDVPAELKEKCEKQRTDRLLRKC